MYNRGWLKTQIKRYLHDQSVDGELDTWIDIGAKRVSQVLECWEMEDEIINSLVVVIGGGVLDGGSAGAGSGTIIDGGDAFNQDPEAAPTEYIKLDDTVRRILGVQRLVNGAWQNLRATSRHEAGRYKREGQAGVYLVENRRIYPLPIQEGDYKAHVIRDAVIPLLDDDEVDVLTSYPMVFLSAALAEAYDWKQDPEMNARYEQRWLAEAEEIRSVYRGNRGGESVAMRAV